MRLSGLPQVSQLVRRGAGPSQGLGCCHGLLSSARSRRNRRKESPVWRPPAPPVRHLQVLSEGAFTADLPQAPGLPQLTFLGPTGLPLGPVASGTGMELEVREEDWAVLSRFLREPSYCVDLQDPVGMGTCLAAPSSLDFGGEAFSERRIAPCPWHSCPSFRDAESQSRPR